MLTSLLFVWSMAGGATGSNRIVHLVPLPETPTTPEFLTAYCGARFARREAGFVKAGSGLLERLRRMPCLTCLRNAPLS